MTSVVQIEERIKPLTAQEKQELYRFLAEDGNICRPRE